VDVLQTESVISILQIDDETLHCTADDRCVVAALVLLVHLARLLEECDVGAHIRRWQARRGCDLRGGEVQVQADDVLVRLVCERRVRALARHVDVSCEQQLDATTSAVASQPCESAELRRVYDGIGEANPFAFTSYRGLAGGNVRGCVATPPLTSTKRFNIM
jgi:hypothetical protein